MAIVTAELREGTAVHLRTRQFSWKGDEPLRAGGTDTAPDSYELLLGALGTCIAATLRLYTRHKGIPLEGVDVELAFERTTTDGEGGGVSERIRSSVRLYGKFDEAQRTRLTQVAQRCPMHRTLARGLIMEDSVEFASEVA
jgi:putative redox protein